MNKNNMLIIGLLSCLMLPLSSCGNENEGLNGINISYENVNTEVASWPHVFYAFDKSNCTAFQTTGDEAGLQEITAAGTYKTILAYETDGNLEISPASAGGNAEGYYVAVKNISGEIPRIYASKSLINESVVRLEPVTAQLTVNVLNAPDDFESLTLRIPGMTDVLYVSSLKTEGRRSLQKKEITLPKGQNSGSFTLFPILGQGNWTLSYSAAYTDGTACEGSIKLEHFIQSGDEVKLIVDLKTSVMTYETSRYDSDRTISSSHPFMNMWADGQEYINANSFYNVYVEQGGRWRAIDVRKALCSDAKNHDRIWNDWNNSKKLRDTMSYARVINPFEGAVKVRVEKRGTAFKGVEVRPSSYQIPVEKITDNMIEFSLPGYKKRKVSVEFDGDRQHNLFLLGGRPDKDKPAQSSGDVIYCGPGEHVVSKLVLTDNQTLYVDEGAVLYTCIEVTGDNVTIAGNGIISGEKLPHTGSLYAEGARLIRVADNTKVINNFKIKDVTLIDSPNWTLALYGTKDAVIDNVNIICWILNGDGIDLTCSTGATVKDCFVRTYDDCVSLKVLGLYGGAKANTNHVQVDNCLLWCDLARCVMVGPEAGTKGEWIYSIRDCEIKNCIVLESTGTMLSVGQEPLSEGGTAMPIENITFSDIQVDNMKIAESGCPIYVFQSTTHQEGCRMENILFKNIRFDDRFGFKNKLVVSSEDARNTISNLVLENIIHNGKAITEGDVEIQGNVNVEIK